MAYLYRHIRLDKNEPFYVGIGEDPKNISIKYVRAHSHSSRNKYWKNIVKKHQYRVDILMDNLTWDQACEKEKEFIRLYGRKDLNLGTLTNLTDGGEGIYNPSAETRMKKSKSMLLFTTKNPNFMKEIHSRRDMISLGKLISERRDHKSAGLKLKETHKKHPEIGKRIGEKIRLNKERGKKLSLSLCKPINQYDMDGNFIKEWFSQKQASQELKISYSGICNCLKKRSKSCGNFKWEYKK